jgi:flagellar biosynthesis protein FlhG
VQFVETGDQAKTLKRMMSGKNNLRVLAVSSGKGGVGKTNLVANLSYALSRKNKRVLIFDADVGLANIHIVLGLAPQFNLGHVLSGQKTLREVIVGTPSGVKVLPAGEGIEELTRLDHSVRLTLLEEFDRLSGDFDFLLFDTGAGISSNVTFFCSIAPEVLLIATPEPTSLTDVFALMKVLSRNHGKKHFRLLINMVRSEKEALEIFRNLSNAADRFLPGVSVEYLGYIVSDVCVPKSVREQKPFIELFPYSKVSKCVFDLCEKLINEKVPISGHLGAPFLWQDVFQVQ